MHKIYMQRCLQLARQHRSDVNSNPVVGALWVHENRILGEGAHMIYGKAHAEVNALKDVKPVDLHLIGSSTLYVSLEPCYHHGKTPPCVDLVLRHRPVRVVLALVDPYPEVSGKSIEAMQKAGIEVITGVEATDAAWINRPFMLLQQAKRPFIRLKFARDSRGYMGLKSGPTWMTGSLSKVLVHRMRSECKGIVVGSGTVLTDQPALTTRFWPGKSPQRIVLDTDSRMSQNHPFFTGHNSAWHIIGGQHAVEWDTAQQRDIKNIDNHLQNHETPAMQALISVIPGLLQRCYAEGLDHLLVEGGRQVLSAFLKLGLWDELVIFNARANLNALYADVVPSPDFLPAFPPCRSMNLGPDRVDFYHHPDTNVRLSLDLQVND